MKEYNFDEMRDMQAKALARVHDMQVKAKYMAEQADRDLNESQAEKSSKYRDNFYNTVNSVPKQNHIRMPVELPEKVKPYESFKEYFEPENERLKEQAVTNTKANLLDDVFNEPDKALLLGLLLLFQSESIDEELMMSLLYIML